MLLTAYSLSSVAHPHARPKPLQTKTLLTIAGFDPSSGAGVTADLMVFAAHGFFGTSCITALTVQNTLGVLATHAVAADTLSTTLDCLWSDLPPAGIKLGMLATAETVFAVADFLTRIRRREPLTVVFDPVLKSSSGKDLLDPSALETLRNKLLPLVDWVTPNIAELGSLLGREVHPGPDLITAASKLQHLGSSLAVVVTGGTLDPPDDLLLLSNSTHYMLRGQIIETTSTHGTGCAFSSALLSRLVLGDDPLQAASAAKSYVAQAMRLALPLGEGHGPLNHLWPLR